MPWAEQMMKGWLSIMKFFFRPRKLDRRQQDLEQTTPQQDRRVSPERRMMEVREASLDEWEACRTDGKEQEKPLRLPGIPILSYLL